MLDKAYVFIETAMGRSREVALALQNRDWVAFVERITGPYDVVVMAQGHRFRDIATAVNEELASMDGVVRTVICPILNAFEPVAATATALVR